MATKRLALELGLVQKRQLKSSLIDKVKKTKQEFDYIVVLDFESTCWENGPRFGGQEIIEFPAVLLDLSNGKIVSEFQQYVMPLEQPVLSEFCTKLTGITQEQVEGGVPLNACLYLFSSWIKKICEEYKISFNITVSGKHATFATWSDWDLGVCLLYECQRKNLRKPEFFNQWIDIRATYKSFYQRRPQGLAGALKDLGIAFEGREHSGICDTRNTAALIARMVRDGCVLTITKSIMPKSKGFSMKAAAQKMFNQVTSVGKRKADETQEKNESKRKPESVLQTDANRQTKNGQNNMPPSIVGCKAQSFSLPSDKEEERCKGKHQDGISFDLGLQDFMGNESATVEKNETQKRNGNNESGTCEVKQGPSTSNGIFKVPNLALCKLKSLICNKSKSSSIVHPPTPKEPNTTPKLLSYANIKTPSNSYNSFNYGSSGASTNRFHSRTFNSPGFNDTLTSMSGFKKTPPLCECGRRAKLLSVSKPGPNQGRYFFACPSGKASPKRCCDFFKWEDEPFVKASPKRDSCVTPIINLNSHLLSKTLPVNRCMQRQKTLGVRRAFSEVTNNKRYNACDSFRGKSMVRGPVPLRDDSHSVEITPYIVKSNKVFKNIGGENCNIK